MKEDSSKRKQPHKSGSVRGREGETGRLKEEGQKRRNRALAREDRSVKSQQGNGLRAEKINCEGRASAISPKRAEGLSQLRRGGGETVRQ